ncbi:MAG TPA: hemolysin family protein, partial [Kofleriaceae bacterium]|nr:hemolysin family protein [Kofleriaceae bacterium]
ASVILIVLIAANALYVAAEFGAVGVRQNRIRRLSDDGRWLARRLLPHITTPQHLDRYVGASQIGITVSSLAAGAYSQVVFTEPLAPVLARMFGLTELAAFSVAALIVLAVLTAVQLVLGELVPKAFALQFPTETALATVLPMEWSLVVFRPAIALLNGGALVLLRLFGAAEQSHRHLHSPEEIDLLIAESREGGLLEPAEQHRLRRALHLGSRRVGDLMVPRSRMTMLSLDASWDEVLRVVLNSPFSRLPVYRGSPDRIVGSLRVKDLVDRYAAEGPVPLERLMRPVLHLPVDLPADRALAALKERHAHSAIVTDAEGRAQGLLTIQDVLTELVGPGEPGGAGAQAAQPEGA